VTDHELILTFVNADGKIIYQYSRRKEPLT
jgi:hypothetical protein